MSALLDTLVPAIVLSLLSLISLRLLRAAPPRMRFGVAMAGLVVWIVPWPLIHVSPALEPLPFAYVESIARVTLQPAELPAPERSVPPSILLLAGVALLVLPGLVKLARDFRSFRASVRSLQREGRSGEHLRELLPADLRRVRCRIVSVPGTRAALTSGVFRPTIWIGDELGGRAELELALMHECQHIKRRDPFWLLLIAVVYRLCWWNPIVAMLAREAELMSEAACDLSCAARLGGTAYLERLARLMLDREAEDPPPLHASARGRDLERLALLRRRVGLRPKDHLLLAAVAATALLIGTQSIREPAKPDWSRVPLPSTAAARALTALLDLVESGGSELIASHLGAYTPQEPVWPFADLASGVEILKVTLSEPRRIEYLVRHRDGSVGLGRLDLFEEDPPSARNAAAARP